ncbi:MAG: aminoglycoside 6-adenylyltransferase [Chloroflexota bacterium]|nr:aminoglycoside 6-adenylyltransferase [Chloroflexota bacterium]
MISGAGAVTAASSAYARLETSIAAWALVEEAIRAALVIGSRARRDHPADDWADLDVLVLTAGAHRFIDDADWIAGIGDPWITFVEPSPDGRAFERRVLFAGGADVDFAFMPVAEAEANLQRDPSAAANVLGRGVRVLADKDGYVVRLLDDLRPAAENAAPNAHAFDEAVADFWYHAVWTAKHLRRGELWWAKSGCDGRLKERLRQVLEWQASAEGRDPWFRGRFLEEWADPATVTELPRAFARYDEGEVWDALAVTMDLFGDVARRSASALGLTYVPGPEQRARELVGELRSGR